MRGSAVSGAVLIGLAVALPAGADMISSEDLPPYEVCGLCHGLDGLSATERFPRLAGQRPGYIEKQLRDFRAGARTNDGGQMQAIVTEITEADIPIVAAWFAAQVPPLPSEAPVDPEGAQIFAKSGCGGCHLAAEPPAGLTVPHITAQHPGYLEKQLRAFRDGERGNDPDGVMRRVASGLTDSEIAALSSYIASLPR